jgi:hypothetical protein
VAVRDLCCQITTCSKCCRQIVDRPKKEPRAVQALGFYRLLPQLVGSCDPGGEVGGLYPAPLQLKPAYAADLADCRKEETPRGPTRGLSLPLDRTGRTRNAGLVPSSCHQQTNNEYARPRFRTQTRAMQCAPENTLRERKAPTPGECRAGLR